MPTAKPRPSPGLQIRRIPLSELNLDPANARSHSSANLDAVRASLSRFGQAEPLVVQAGTLRIIGGHARLEAMHSLGWKECDVVEGKARVVGNEHPTQKPTRLFEIPMEQHTKARDLVLEPFSGSGSQIVAAEKLFRRCVAIEISPAFVDVAITRWEMAAKKNATLDGKSFEDVARERGVKDASHYCQVSVCMAWAMHRVLWTLKDRPDSDEWREKYFLLDRAFRSFVEDWDKPLARAFVRWTDLQLDFCSEGR